MSGINKPFAGSWFGVALALVLMYFAMRVGLVWDSTVNPTPDVRVTFADGGVEVGSLSRNWAGEYVLSMNDGGSVVFDDDWYRGMAWSRPASQRGLISGWRALLPPLLVVVIWLSMAMKDIQRGLGSAAASVASERADAAIRKRHELLEAEVKARVDSRRLNK